MDNHTTRLCPTCGKEFQITAKHPNVRFCSESCFRESRRETRCCACGKEFRVSKGTRKKYCSAECGFRFRPKREVKARKICICDWCKNGFTVWNSRPGRFCSHLCRSKYAARQPKKIGIVAPQSRGKNWSTQRKLALARDSSACQICGKKKSKIRTHDITVHHIVKYGDFQNDYITANQLSNLITLCRLCHEQVENYGLPCPKRMF